MSPTRPSILLVGDTLNVGGTEGQFVEVACGLDRSRWDVHLTCRRATGPLRATLEAAGLSVWSCGTGSFKSPRFARTLWTLVRYLRRHRITLVHCFDFYSNIVGVIAARLARVPAIIASQRELGDLRTPLERRCYRVTRRLADYVLVNADAIAERLGRERAAGSERVIVIPNGVDTVRFAPPRTPPRDRAGYVLVGALANLRPEKGLDDLVRAMALVHERYPRERLAIWGDGPLRADLERLVREVELTDSVTLHGRTVTPEAALRAMDIFVLPSRSEACSNVLLEAMASGRAIVTTRVGGNPALVDDEVTGLLVPPDDPAALAKAILRLVEDPRLTERLGAGARTVARTHFSLGRMVCQVETLYARALDGLAGPPPAHRG